MAASTANVFVDENMQFMEDIDEFECDVEETEAVNDLQDLLFSDDELFIDLDSDEKQNETEIVHTSPTHVMTQPHTSVDNTSRSNMQCPKCQRTYKRQWHFVKHTEACTGKRRTTPTSTTNKMHSKRKRHCKEDGKSKCR